MLNSNDKPATGVARNIETQVGKWKGKLDFKVIPLGEYDLILAMDFFDSARAMVDMRTKSIIITDP